MLLSFISKLFSAQEAPTALDVLNLKIAFDYKYSILIPKISNICRIIVYKDENLTIVIIHFMGMQQQLLSGTIVAQDAPTVPIAAENYRLFLQF